MKNRRILLLTNPNSGKGRAPKIALDIYRYARTIGITVIILEPGHSKDVAAEVERAINESAFDAVVAIGGDGLVHLALQVITKFETPLYVVPAGTGNDFARSSQSMSLAPRKILETIYERTPQKIDLGEISHGKEVRRFGQILSTGFDAQVNERANQNRIIKGRMKYNYATLAVLPNFEPIDYSLEIDGAVRNIQAMLVAVANAPSYGGGMKLCPMANRSDGFLDVMILHPVTKLELLKVFPRVFSGSHVSHPAVEFLRVRKIEISAKTCAYADGERIGALPISVSVTPFALTTWVNST